MNNLDENISLAKDYIQIARDLKSKGDKAGATLRYQYAIKLLRSSQGTLARKLLEQTLEEFNELTSQGN